MRLERKIAVITGAASGIGEATAHRFAEEGALIAILDRDLDGARNVAEALERSGNRAVAIRVDISSKEEVQAAFHEVLALFGRIDILVNNAGFGPNAPVLEIKGRWWDKVIDTNLKGCFLCSQAVVPPMIEQKSGRIINIASTAALGGVYGTTHYASSKAGVIGLTRALALELAPHNITVNAVAPGTIETRGAKGFIEFYRDILNAEIPLGRVGQPRDIANAVLFFASDEASYITGQCLFVCGGASFGRP